MPLRFALTLAFVSLSLLLFPHHALAQSDEHSLSQAEIEQLRDTAYYPPQRVELFIKLLDERVKAIQDLYAHPRKPGREQDTHDLLNQFNSIANELEDNLDDYSSGHRDIRKALSKLLEATERWSSAIKSPPDNEAYNVSRKLALETIRDVHDDATEITQSQKTWFKDHPPSKENRSGGAIDIPR